MNDNILKVSFGGVRSVTANPLWQYDYGQTLLIKGLNLPELYEVHFAPSKTGNAVTVIGTDEGVSIPDALLETAGEFFAWIYMHTGEADGETEYQIKIPVKERAKPTHETPTPVQQTEIEQIIAALEAENERARTEADEAEASAESAKTSELNAKASEESASASAQSAASSATSSASSASAATQAKEATETGIAQAKQYAESAEASATSASGSASTAESAKADAVSAKNDAVTANATAQTAATTATTKASEASASASSAASSATSASASASTATSAKNDAVTAKTAAEAAQASAQAAKTAAETAQEAAEAAVSSLADFAPTVVNTASGNIASFTDGADDYPVKDLVVDIEPVQSGSGDPSPDNVRPITGWTGANVTRTGKNLVDSSNANTGLLSVTVGDSINTIITSSRYSHSDPINCENGVAVSAVSADVGRFNAVYINLYNNDILVQTVNHTFNDTSSWNYVVPANTYEKVCLVYGAPARVAIGTDIAGNIQVELGSTATAYEPYNGTTYSVTFPTEAGTIYGGTLDVTTGVLTVDRKLYTFTGNEQFGLVTSTHNFFRWYSQSFVNTITDWKIPNEIKLSSYPATIKAYWDAGANTNKSAWTVRAAAGVCFRNDDYSTASEFAASLVGQGMLYELAEPVTYQLTPTEVKTLLGANNIFADTGDVNVEYCADTKKHIDNAIATVSDYVLTAQDKSDIADLVLAQIPYAEGVGF